MSRRSLLLAASRFAVTASASESVPTTALSFNGTNAYAVTPSGTAFDMNANYTIACYMKPGALVQKGMLWVVGSADGLNYDTLLVRPTTGLLEFQCVMNDAEVLNTSFGTGDGTLLNAWTKIVLTRSGSTIKVYAGTSDFGTNTAVVTGRAASQRVGVGAFAMGTPVDTNYLGAIMGLNIWSAALTDTQVAAENGHLRPVRTTALWGSYMLSSPSDLVEHTAARSAFVASGSVGTEGTVPAGVAI